MVVAACGEIIGLRGKFWQTFILVILIPTKANVRDYIDNGKWNLEELRKVLPDYTTQYTNNILISP